MDGSVIFFYEKCRLCLTELGFRIICQTEGLAKDIQHFFGVRITPDDNLPQKICSNCWEVLSSAKKLKSIAAKNDTHLRCLFGDKQEDEITRNMEKTEESDDIETKNHDTKRALEDNTNRKKMNSSTSDKDLEEDKPAIKIRKDLFKTPKVESPRKQNLKNSPTKSEISLEDMSEDDQYKIYKDGFQCLICYKIFETWKKMYLHLRLHNKTIPCPLDACGKKFATKGDLEKHIRTHTGERPFKCDQCDKSFSQKGTLKVHRETVHNLAL